jgi:hypothetical protein
METGIATREAVPIRIEVDASPPFPLESRVAVTIEFVLYAKRCYASRCAKWATLPSENSFEGW